MTSLDHLFMDFGYRNGTINEVALVRTNRKGIITNAQLLPIDKTDGSYTKALTVAADGIAKGKYCIVMHDISKHRFEPFNFSPVISTASKRLSLTELAWPLIYSSIISDAEIDTLCINLKLQPSIEDSAASRCESIVNVYWELMRRYRTALLGEEAVRDYAGETVDKLRRFIGI